MQEGLKRAAIGCATAALGAFYALCRLLPRRQQIVCISRQSDTAPVDFQMISSWVEDNARGWRVVIMADTLKNPVSYLPVMLRQVRAIAQSRVVVLDSYCIVVSLLHDRIRVPVVQIWHALGNMKKFGYTALDTEEGHSSSTARLMHMHEGYDAVAVSSLSFADDLAAGFNVPTGLLFEAPLPRTDLLLSEGTGATQRAAFFESYPEAKGKKVIVYCPTFRKKTPANEDEAMRALLGAIDFDRYCLVFKPHPVSTQVIEDERVITLEDSSIDPLYSADYVISDYSTVIYEAGLLGLPVFLYAYDWDSYHEKRAFNIDLERDVPTLFADDPTAIMDAIESETFDRKAFDDFVKRNVALPNGQSCTEHLCRTIVSLAEDARA